MKKVLIVTHVSGFVPQFEMNNVRILQELGYEVHYASNYNTPSYGTDNSRLDGTGIVRHQIDFVRSPFSFRANRKAYTQLKQLMLEIPFELVHCHTPMGGALARIVAKATNTGPLIYTVHGFHFYKGAPLLNWLIYYPAERYLSRFTDLLVTINQEDYHRAKSFHAGELQYIPGVGIDYSGINETNIDIGKKREELGVPENHTLILSVGELIKRKNYETGLKAFAKANLPDSTYLICGHGVLNEHLKRLAKQLGIADRVIFAGYRKDIIEIMKCADVFLFPSYQEGLPAALMEAMACGLPVLCSKIRGNTDLIEQDQGGFLYHPKDSIGFAQGLINLAKNHELRRTMKDFNIKAVKRFSKEHVIKLMKNNYQTILERSK